MRQGQIGSVDDVRPLVPLVLRVSAAVAWRLLAVGVALYWLGQIAGYLAVVAVPVAVALLLAALLAPVVGMLVRRKVPRGLATALAVIGGLTVVGGILTAVIVTFSNGLPALQAQVAGGLNTINNWLQHGPLHLSQRQLQGYVDRVVQTVKNNQGAITSGAVSTVATVGTGLTGALLTLFTLIFFLHDGDRIWHFVIRIVPEPVRARVDVAGQQGFASLVNYVRGTAAVAVVDAVGIGVGLAIVGVPLVVPLAALVFLAAFVPIIGAVVAGTVAVLVALVANGFISALVVAGVVIAVMQLEGHLLQPLLLGRVVQLHPLAVVLAIAVGLESGGIAGALLAVPLLAVLNAGAASLWRDRPDHTKASHRAAIPAPGAESDTHLH